MVTCGVLGSPIAHSLSPVMHRAAYAHLGLTDWAYEAHEVTEDGLAGFLARLDRSWRGLSLTMPLKHAVIGLLDEVSDEAAAVRAVNTVVLGDNRRSGHNTDVPGAVGALRERGITEVGDAIVIGAGATARSMVAALRHLGLARLTIGVRAVPRAAELADLARSWGLEVDVRPLDAGLARATQLVVSTVPSSAVAPFAVCLAASGESLFDVVYDPWPGALAAAAGCASGVVSGLDLLAHQAALQVELMCGRSVPAAILRDAALAAWADGGCRRRGTPGP